jgi:hypothetical protein
LKFDGEQIMALLMAWRKLGKRATFVADSCGSAYVFNQKGGETLQFVTPEGMCN